MRGTPVEVQTEQEAQQRQEDLPVRMRVDVIHLGDQLHSKAVSQCDLSFKLIYASMNSPYPPTGGDGLMWLDTLSGIHFRIRHCLVSHNLTIIPHVIVALLERAGCRSSRLTDPFPQSMPGITFWPRR